MVELMLAILFAHIDRSIIVSREDHGPYQRFMDNGVSHSLHPLKDGLTFVNDSRRHLNLREGGIRFNPSPSILVDHLWVLSGNLYQSLSFCMKRRGLDSSSSPTLFLGDLLNSKGRCVVSRNLLFPLSSSSFLDKVLILRWHFQTYIEMTSVLDEHKELHRQVITTKYLTWLEHPWKLCLHLLRSLHLWWLLFWRLISRKILSFTMTHR